MQEIFIQFLNLYLTADLFAHKVVPQKYIKKKKIKKIKKKYFISNECSVPREQSGNWLANKDCTS